MYSLKMSVCSVPSSLEISAPWRWAAARYMQNTGAAGPLIVIEVVTSASGMPENSRSMSAAESIATPAVPDFAGGPGIVGVPAHQRRHVEGNREPGAAGVEQHLVALVGLTRAAEPRRTGGSSRRARGTRPGKGRG
jgi:hypothetical protein